MMILDNLKKVTGWLILQGRASSQRELASRMGYNPSAFSQILNGHVPVSDKFLNRLAAYEPKININWVKTGKGEMLYSGNPLMEATLDDDEADLEFFTENNTSYDTTRCAPTRSLEFAASRVCASSRTFVHLPTYQSFVTAAKVFSVGTASQWERPVPKALWPMQLPRLPMSS